mmetsp:Transcript_3533/g.8431  ORF Transcript_3533/g.8431 Transcript_3533/m.8431 type:complete len:208 (-) Transcript_3533:93-716(-)
MYMVSFFVCFVPSGSSMKCVIYRVTLPSSSHTSFTSVMMRGVSIFNPIFLVVRRPASSRAPMRSKTPSLISWSFRVPEMYPFPPGTFLMARGPFCRSSSSTSTSSTSGVPPQPGGGRSPFWMGVELAGIAGSAAANRFAFFLASSSFFLVEAAFFLGFAGTGTGTAPEAGTVSSSAAGESEASGSTCASVTTAASLAQQHPILLNCY